MKDKPEKPEIDLPPPCQNCRSLHKKYDSPPMPSPPPPVLVARNVAALPDPRAVCSGVGVRSPQI